ncbi:unnamed protein product, partial [marine sediment metagenome]
MSLLDNLKEKAVQTAKNQLSALGNEFQVNANKKVNEAKNEIASSLSNLNVIIANARKMETQLKLSLNTIESRLNDFDNKVENIGNES